MLHTDYLLGAGNILVKMVPSLIGLGLITSLYTGLISGTEVVLISTEKDIAGLAQKLVAFVKGFGDYKAKFDLRHDSQINIFTAPAVIRAFIPSPEVTDLSFIGSMLAGGSKMEKEELDALEKVAIQKGCTVPICNGYGQNEMAGAVTLNTVHHNKNGSAGFPTFATEIIVVDPETKNILPPNETGLVLENSNSCFLRYENMTEKTEAAFITLPDGSRWFNSCDLGYFDDDGFLYITGRTTRVVIRFDVKVSLDEVERKLQSLPFIHDCAVISSKHDGPEEQITAFLVAPNVIETDIQSKIENANILSGFEIPAEIYIVDKLPYKTSGKIDYERLKEQYLRQR